MPTQLRKLHFILVSLGKQGDAAYSFFSYNHRLQGYIVHGCQLFRCLEDRVLAKDVPYGIYPWSTFLFWFLIHTNGKKSYFY